LRKKLIDRSIFEACERQTDSVLVLPYRTTIKPLSITFLHGVVAKRLCQGPNGNITMTR
jgi:hypothetical protein